MRTQAVDAVAACRGSAAINGKSITQAESRKLIFNSRKEKIKYGLGECYIMNGTKAQLEVSKQILKEAKQFAKAHGIIASGKNILMICNAMTRGAIIQAEQITKDLKAETNRLNFQTKNQNPEGNKTD